MPQAPSATRFRPEIQALRAVATIIGVGFHLWPKALPGGFYGNEVFFVLSGFLITSLITREVERTGRISLPHFWARRARRLLPAAQLVLLAAGIGTLLFLRKSRWHQAFVEISDCAIYLQNWRLAADGIDYWAAAQAPSPVQHYWSLAVEEQFYLIWPIMIALTVAISSKLRVGRNSSIRMVLSSATAASLAYWIWATRSNPTPAYYDTATHAWQFGVGGLLSVCLGATESPAALRSACSWAGLIMIAFAAFFFTSNTSLLGFSALVPVLGTSAVIWAGAPNPAWAPTSIFQLSAVQFLGEISYAVCLWHWPLIIILPEVLGHPLGDRSRTAVALGSVLAAALTKIAIEDPFRYGQALRAREPRYTFALATAGMAALLAFSAVTLKSLRDQLVREEDDVRRILNKGTPCLGAAARDPDHPPCRNQALDGLLIPSDLLLQWRPTDSLLTFLEPKDPVPDWEFGVPEAQAKLTFALVGDSTASRMASAFAAIAKERRWHGFAIISCAATAVQNDPSCVAWNGLFLRWLARHPEVDTLFTTAFSRPGQDRKASDGYRREWDAMPGSIKRIIVIRSNPANLRPACVQDELERGHKPALVCADPRALALAPDPAVEAAVRLGSARVNVIDLTPFYCDAELCYHVIGGVRVFRDFSHVSKEYWRTLSPYLARKIDALGLPGPVATELRNEGVRRVQLIRR